MNKKYLILPIVAIVIVVAAIVGIVLFNYYQSFHKVTVNIKDTGLTVTVFKRDLTSEDSNNDKNVGDATGSQVLSLQDGKYYAVAKGNDYDTSQISFEVSGKDTSVNVSPNYSSAKLSAMLTSELPTINSVVSAKYDLESLGFTLDSGKLYENGDWYGATLVQKTGEHVNGDVYRIVLHKQNGTWNVATTPQLILTIPDNPSIPEDILTDLNNQTGYDN